MDERLAAANLRLKAGKVGVAIVCRGDRLWLRGTFPPKPGSTQVKPYQQKLSLGVRANPAGVQHAERQARLLGAQLNLGQFDWGEWVRGEEKSGDRGTVAEWVERFEQAHWDKTKRTLKAEETWQTDYLRVFQRLPQDEVLTVERVLAVIRGTEPDSRPRRRVVQALGKLGRFAGLEADFTELMGSYSAGSVNPRMLPGDGAIAEVRGWIKPAGWRWVFGMMACYGLRNHEVFRCNLVDFPLVRIEPETKTGSRFVYPLYPEWAEAWGLDERVLPRLQVLETAGNSKLGAKVSGFFNDAKIPFKPYDLRHCYARRCFEFGLGVDLGAQLMGHSPEVHKRTYRAWIDEGTYRKVFDALIYRGDRPLPPSEMQRECPATP